MSKSKREELVARARDMVPTLRERAEKTEADRIIPEQTHREFLEAEFYRIHQPERYGGLELDLGAIVDIAAEIGRGCGSSAWIFTNLALHPWINGMKDPKAQEDIWGDDPDTLVASSFPGQDSRIDRVDGGFVVNGTWRFSSGVDFAQWNHLQLFLRSEDGALEHRFGLVPQSDYEVIDDWYATGLVGTGSKSIVLKDAFIPEYRTITAQELHGGATKGSKVNPNVLYRLSYWGVGGKAFVGPAIGLARGVLEQVENDISSRTGVGHGAKLWEQQTVHMRIAEAEAEIAAARALALRDCAEGERMAEAGETPDLLERTRFRRNNAYAILMCTRAVERLFPLSGMRGIEPGNHVQRAWRDVHTIGAQIAVAWDTQAGNYGRARFGLPFTDPRA